MIGSRRGSVQCPSGGGRKGRVRSFRWLAGGREEGSTACAAGRVPAPSASGSAKAKKREANKGEGVGTQAQPSVECGGKGHAASRAVYRDLSGSGIESFSPGPSDPIRYSPFDKRDKLLFCMFLWGIWQSSAAQSRWTAQNRAEDAGERSGRGEGKGRGIKKAEMEN